MHGVICDNCRKVIENWPNEGFLIGHPRWSFSDATTAVPLAADAQSMAPPSANVGPGSQVCSVKCGRALLDEWEKRDKNERQVEADRLKQQAAEQKAAEKLARQAANEAAGSNGSSDAEA